MVKNFLAAYAPQADPVPSSGSEWADRTLQQAQQVPAPLIYPESPWRPRIPDYEGALGRVYDPMDIMRTQQALRDYPPVQTESGDQLSPSDLKQMAEEAVPAQPRSGERYPWWGWRLPPVR